MISMNTFEQVKAFYISLNEEEKSELCETIAEDIFFLEDNLQERILELLQKAEPELAEKIRRINDFTT